MLTFSVIWILLAATVTLLATLKKSAPHSHEGELPGRDSGKALTVIAALYGLVLLAGFVYISKFLVSSL